MSLLFEMKISVISEWRELLASVNGSFDRRNLNCHRLKTLSFFSYRRHLLDHATKAISLKIEQQFFRPNRILNFYKRSSLIVICQFRFSLFFFLPCVVQYSCTPKLAAYEMLLRQPQLFFCVVSRNKQKRQPKKREKCCA